MAAGNDSPTKKYLQSKWSSSKEPSSVRLASIIQARNTEELEHFLKETKWDVNQMFPTDSNSFPYERCIYSQKSDRNDHKYWISAIHLVADEYWREGLGVLIKAGADINLCDSVECADGYHQPFSPSSKSSGIAFTPLMRAIHQWPRFKNLAFVEELLEHGADPNLRCPNTNNSAISLAVASREQCVIDLILRKSKGDLNVMFHNTYGFTSDILSFACHMMKRGLAYGCHHSVVLQPKVIKDLVNHGADVNAHSYNLLSELCSGSFSRLDLEILDILFKGGIDINVVHDKCTILHKSYGMGGNWVRWLIRHGAYTNLFSPEYLCFWSGCGKSYDDLFLLVQAGIMPLPGDIMALRSRTLRGTLLGSDLQTTCDEIKLSIFMQWNRGRHVERQHQEADLLEFSDETLHAFPERWEGHMSENKKKLYMKQIIDFVSEPPRLQCRCRQFIRQTLVSHSPNVVKGLPLPSVLKRYLLCHEL